jgi:hypothetical protein
LGYLFAPKERDSDKDDAEDEEETPEWVLEVWEYLIHKEFRYQPKEPSWLGLPAMMRMVMSSPNVMRNRRPEWLAPFSFFLFPMISNVGAGYPAGFDKSSFKFITPAETNRKKWKQLEGINLFDEQIYQISMVPDPSQRKVTPDSFQIILNEYLGKPEVKSLAPDGTPCDAETRGLLGRATVLAKNIMPVGKETDRHWEQGEDPSMLDPKIEIFGPSGKMVVAEPADREKWLTVGIRKWKDESKLSQKAVYAVLAGKPVRRHTLAVFRAAAEALGV